MAVVHKTLKKKTHEEGDDGVKEESGKPRSQDDGPSSTRRKAHWGKSTD